MALEWIREELARWDANKARIIGRAPAGIFDTRYAACSEGDLLPSDWWIVERDGQIVGYGWLDVVWGDAEILLAVDASAQREGIGTFILDRLEGEARKRSLHYLYNVVRGTHPHTEDVTAFLTKRGFKPSEDGRLLRAVVRAG